MAEIENMLVVVLSIVVLLTARDLSFGPAAAKEDTSSQDSHFREHQNHVTEAETLEARRSHVPKPNFNAGQLGPVLRFSFCYSWGYRNVFEQYKQLISQRYPSLRVEGVNYPPHPVKFGLAQALSVLKVIFIILIAVGRNPFEYFGMQTPQFFIWAINNKIYACMMLFFVSNMVEGQLVATGAFEVYYNDIPVWSKLQSGRVPEPAEVFQILDSQMKMSAGSSAQVSDGDFMGYQ